MGVAPAADSNIPFGRLDELETSIDAAMARNEDKYEHRNPFV